MPRLLGVVHYALFPASGSGTGDISDTFEPVLSDGDFGAIEVTWIKDDRERSRAAEILRRAGIQVMFSGGPPLLSSGLSLSDVDNAGRAKAVGLAKRLVDMACELGARNLLVSSGPDPGSALREDALSGFRRSLEEICSYAVDRRPENPVVVCVEPFDREVQWRQLLGPTALAAALVREVRRSLGNCGITLDMSHVAQLREDLTRAIDSAGDCLVHAHLANCVLDPADPLFGDMHPGFDVPGGAYRPEDMGRYLAALDRSGFFSRPCPYGQPVASIEVRPAPGQAPAEVLSACKPYLGLTT